MTTYNHSAFMAAVPNGTPNPTKNKIMKKNYQKLLVAALALSASIFYDQAKAATAWDSAIALYAFSNNLVDSNGDNDGVSWRRTGNSEVPAQFTNVGSSDLPGWDGMALSLGDSRYVNFGQGASNAFQITGSLTIFARVYINSNSSTLPIFSKDGTSGNRSYSLSLGSISETNGILSARLNGNKTVSYTNTNITTEAWLDLAVVYETSSRFELYLNGLSVGILTNSVPSTLINNSNTPLLLGANPQGSPIGSDHWSGMIERAAIWNTALTDEQVQSLSIVPEPSTSMLIVSALLCLALRKIHHRRTIIKS